MVARCIYCGARINDLEKMIRHFRTHSSEGERTGIYVEVWNGEISTLLISPDGYWLTDDQVRDDEEINRLAEESVRDAGGAFDRDGLYPPNTKLRELVLKRFGELFGLKG